MNQFNKVARESLQEKAQKQDAALEKLIAWKLSPQTSASMAFECLKDLQEAFPRVSMAREAMGIDDPIKALNIAAEGVIGNLITKVKAMFGSVDAQIKILDQKTAKLASLDLSQIAEGEIEIPMSEKLRPLIGNNGIVGGDSKYLLQVSSVIKALKEDSEGMSKFLDAVDTVISDIAEYDTADKNTHPLTKLYGLTKHLYMLRKGGPGKGSEALCSFTDPSMFYRNALISFHHPDDNHPAPFSVFMAVIGTDKNVGNQPVKLPATVKFNPRKELNPALLQDVQRIKRALMQTRKELQTTLDTVMTVSVAHRSNFLLAYYRLGKVLGESYPALVGEVFDAYASLYESAASSKQA